LSAWTETIFVLSIAFIGIFLGILFSRLRNPYWMCGYFLSFVFLMILIGSRFYSFFIFGRPFCWMIAGRARYVLFGLAVTVGLMSPLSRLPKRGQKILTCVLMSIFVIWFSVLPFLLPALIENDLLNLPTRLDSDGVCLQSTDFTCGPAAAVTALGKMGFQTSEGQLAVLARTNPIAGTMQKCLSDALSSLYEQQGLQCRYRHFDSVEQLKSAEVALVVVKGSFLTDHCVVVLEVSDQAVCIADPSFGKVFMERADFEKVWRFSGITLNRLSNRI
jgi:predicted double-glycine peptidase